MKLNHKFVRTVTTTAAVLGAAAMLSVGAFAAEADINDPAAAGYLPPQEQMVQGDIALHSADVAIGEKDPTYGGYGAPEGNPIQGNIMLISGDELAAPSADAAAKKSEARYTVRQRSAVHCPPEGQCADAGCARRFCYFPHHRAGHADPAERGREHAGGPD